MTSFRVKTIDVQGAAHEEFIEANDRAAAYGTIRNNGATILSIDEVKKSVTKSILSADLPFLSSVKLRDKIIFTRNLASMLDAGLALSRALTVIEKQNNTYKVQLSEEKTKSAIDRANAVTQTAAAIKTNTTIKITQDSKK